MKMRCCIVDDEPPALDLLDEYVGLTESLEMAGRFTNPIEALNFVQNQGVDLIFLDVNMPEISGVELSKIISDKALIIFTTAYREYAVDGFKVNAVDYLVKPISFVDFTQAVARAIDRRFNNLHDESRTHIFVKADYKTQRIEFAQLLFIENLKDYVRFHHKDGSTIMSLLTLKSVEAKLPSYFMKVHRSFFVNLKEVRSVERNRIIFGKHLVPVAEAYRSEFQRFLSEH